MPRPLAALLTAAAAAAFLLLPVPEASAAPTPSVSPSTVQRGGSVTVSGTGCWDPDYDPYGGTGRLAWWVSVATTPWNSSWTHVSASTQTVEWDGGAWSVTLPLPPDTMGPGSYAAYAHCVAGPNEFDYPAAPFTVVGDPIPPKWWEPGGSGPPGQPKGPSAPPPAPAGNAARTTAPRPTSAPSSGVATVETPGATSAPTPAHAAAPTPDCPDCAALSSNGALRAGRELRLSYAGFQPGETVTVVLHSTPVTLGTFTADATGTVTATITLPDGTESGEHTLTFSGPASGDLVVVPFRVAAVQSTGPTERRAAAPRSDGRTVTSWVGGGGLAVVLLSLGAHLLLRRRENASAAS